MDGFDSQDRPAEPQSESVLKIVILGEPGVGKVRFNPFALQYNQELSFCVRFPVYRPHKICGIFL